MYPTLNISLLAQPGTAASGETAALPLLDGAEMDLAESFQASLARSLLPGAEGGNPLPLEGTALPEPELSADLVLDDLVPEGELAAALPIDAPGIQVELPEAVVPDALPVAAPVTSEQPAPGLVPGIEPETASPVTVPAAPAGAELATAQSRPTPPVPGLAAARRPLQPASSNPPGTDPGPAVPTPMAAAELRPGQSLSARVVDAAGVARQAVPEAREFLTPRQELAIDPAEPAAPRPGEQRPVFAASLPPIEPSAILGPAVRPTINIATPVNVSALQPAGVDGPIQTPVGEPGFDDAIADRVWVMTQARLGNAEIRLTPAELGPVRIQVAVDDGTANVSFQAAQAATREAIEQALPRLRELFAENGLSLGQASVGDDGVRDGHRETPEQAAVNLSDDAGEDAGAETAAADAPRSSRHALAGTSLVDTFA